MNGATELCLVIPRALKGTAALRAQGRGWEVGRRRACPRFMAAVQSHQAHVLDATQTALLRAHVRPNWPRRTCEQFASYRLTFPTVLKCLKKGQNCTVRPAEWEPAFLRQAREFPFFVRD